MPEQWDLEFTWEFDQSVAEIYSHWVCPDARARYELDEGLTCENFDLRECGVETIRIAHEGREVGVQVQRYHSVVPNQVIVMSIDGHSNGVQGILMQVAIQFDEASKGGCDLTVKVQAMDLDGHNGQEVHEAGWDGLLESFADDLMGQSRRTAVPLAA
ncbi:MAG: SRPBCC domain-containing protein [Pseudomonadota bacterium]